MNFKQTVTKFHYGKCGKFSSILLFLAFLIPSVVYSFVIRFKNFLYSSGLFRLLKEKTPQTSKTAKIICIGNLTTGGVGKTPVTIEFARYLSKFKKVSTLSRGYGGTLQNPTIVRNYTEILLENPEIIGDEVKLIAENASPKYFERNENLENHEGYAVTVSKDRKKGAELAIEQLEAEIIIMDDGFSNRKLKKDLTLLLFDTKKFIGNGFLLPLGPLREPLKEIKRADGIILVDKENTDPKRLLGLKEFLFNKFKKPVFVSKFAPESFYDILDNKMVDIKGFPLFAFSAIGQPEQFYNYLKLTPDTLLKTISFDDHHSYTPQDLEKIIKEAKKADAKYIITTEKDAVKIKPLLESLQKTERLDNILETPKILAMKLMADIDVKKILSEVYFNINN